MVEFLRKQRKKPKSRENNKSWKQRPRKEGGAEWKEKFRYTQDEEGKEGNKCWKTRPKEVPMQSSGDVQKLF